MTIVAGQKIRGVLVTCWSSSLDNKALPPACCAFQIASGFLRGYGGSPFAFLCSAFRTHDLETLRKTDGGDSFTSPAVCNRRNAEHLARQVPQMGSDRVDHGGLLANEQLWRAMEHQATLLLWRFGLDEVKRLFLLRRSLARIWIETDDCLRPVGVSTTPFHLRSATAPSIG